MPKIRAYVGNSALIPVTDATITTAYQCPWTQKLFKRKSEYVKHLKHLREFRMHSKARCLSRGRCLQELWSLPTFDDVVAWFSSNSKLILDNASKTQKIDPELFWFKITYLDLTWAENVSNSHCCPHNGVTNWGRRDLFKDGTAKPTGYPGWTGHIEYQTSHDTGFGIDLVSNLRIHTGTGGGLGNHRYGYGVTFFDADWPGIHSYSTLSEQKMSFKFGKPVYFR